MPRKFGKQRKQPAPFPPMGSEESHEPQSNPGIHVGVAGGGGIKDIVTQERKSIILKASPRHENIQSGNVIYGKASFPGKPPQEMALTSEHNQPSKRYCPAMGPKPSLPADNYYASAAACYASGIRSEMVGTGIFETGTNSNVSSYRVDTSRTVLVDNANASNNISPDATANEVGWISYLWSFFSLS